MNPLALLKPEYLYRPRQLIRRLFGTRASGEEVDVVLPWGMPIRVSPRDDIGRAILTLGVFELATTETIWRLTDPGAVAADVGANIGYMTAVFAARVGPSGKVVAFEPHRELFESLRANVSRFGNAGFRLENAAASRARGTVALEVPPLFATNRGTARVADAPSPDALRVDAVTLDDAFADGEPPAILKIDVEGHELAVLEGAAKLLASRRVRDCVFEEHARYPTDVTRLLESHGYEVLRIERGLFGVRLLPAASTAARSSWEATNLLATLDPARARERLAPRGWRSLAAGSA